MNNFKYRLAIGSLVAASVVGFIGAPLASAAFGASPVSSDTTVNAIINSSISVTSGSGGTVNMTITPAPGGVLSSNSEILTVATNYTTGYTLKVADKDAVLTLANGGNTIAASANTTASPAALLNNTWGFAVGGLGSFDASYSAQSNVLTASSTTKWAGMPASGSGYTIKTNNAATAGDTVTVWYAADADTSKVPGTYFDVVTYTATNP